MKDTCSIIHKEEEEQVSEAGMGFLCSVAVVLIGFGLLNKQVCGPYVHLICNTYSTRMNLLLTQLIKVQ